MKGKIKEIFSRMAYLHIEYEKAWKSMKQFGLGGMGEEKCEKVRKEMKEKSEKVLKREEKGRGVDNQVIRGALSTLMGATSPQSSQWNSSLS